MYVTQYITNNYHSCEDEDEEHEEEEADDDQEEEADDDIEEEEPEDQVHACFDLIKTPYADLSYESVGVWAAEDLVWHLDCLRDAGELADDGVDHNYAILR